MNNERIALPYGRPSGPRPVTMRGPADMAELLPYLLGFFPDDSIVAVGLQGPELHQGGVIRLDIPESPAHWPAVAEETAALLVGLSEQRDRRPAQVLLYLCQDPGSEHGPPVLDRLRPLAAELRAEFESRGVGVKESLCVSLGRWWSFLCRREGCCDPAGHPIRHAPDPGPVAVAATFAGLAPRGSRKAIVAGLAPVGPPAADAQRLALARGEGGGGAGRGPVLSPEQGAELLDQAVAEFVAGARELDEHRTAQLLFALKDRRIRDRAAEYARPAELAPAQRLWRFLARRCVPPYTGCAPPPLTLLAWVSWVAGDVATARVVLAHVLRLDPSYLLAQLLYDSLNGGLSADPLLVRAEAERRRRTGAGEGAEPGAGPADGSPPGQGRDQGDQGGERGRDRDGGRGQGLGREPGQGDGERRDALPGPDGDPPGGSGRGPGRPPASASASARSRRRRARRGQAGPASSVGPEAVPGGPAEGPAESRGPGRADDGRPTDLLTGCRPTAQTRPERGLRLGRPSPWAPALSAGPPGGPAGRRGRCRAVRGAAIGPRHAG
ncbi:DUF4192 domain-containing protein [Kitasatospora sp. NPDC127111]|uniref:DUF4192 domain-containing protein n=1 Tax=Kitasatospora sp. NPDC127111 TaxID=3345363 RepID=UPI00362875D7